MFKSKKDKFAVLLAKISANIDDSAEYFSEFRAKNVSDLKVFTETMRQYEHTGDDFTHEIIKELNDAFITPIEREDLLSLAMVMDDVMDNIDHSASFREMFSLVETDEYEEKFLSNIKEATQLIDEAISLLGDKKLLAVRDKIVAIKDVESRCDTVYRAAVKNIFNSNEDPIMIMKRNQTYESLENIADGCQTVANVLESIVMKNV